ncbi:MAG: 50S ribosomal protein L3 [Candidatus Saganbacteria bacterium]|nr:50S ribosomal protein L3 [Candidatus Saganbacteria bacterium]
MAGLLGRKKGMTQIFDAEGRALGVTLIEVGPCVVLQKKTIKKDGYQSIQLGFGARKKINKPLAGHLKGQKSYFLREFKLDNMDSLEVGSELKVDLFKVGEKVAVRGISIGKGTQGTVRRWHFNRGPMSHGSKCHRLPGSIGAGTTPGRVFKGLHMAGRMGNKKITVKNLKVVAVDADKNLLILKGAVPGKDGSLLEIRSIS